MGVESFVITQHIVPMEMASLSWAATGTISMLRVSSGPP